VVFRNRQLPGIIMALAVLSPLVLPQPSLGQLEEVEVVLSAKAARVRRGDAFVFRAQMRNLTAETRSRGIVLEISKRGSGDGPIPFLRWLAVAGPHDTDARRFSVSTTRFWYGAGRFRLWARDGEGALLATPLTFEVTRSRRVLPRFRDASAETGTASHHQANPNRVTCDFAAGAAWGDIEGDGDLDLYLPHQTAPAQLFVNDGGSFSEQASQRGVDNVGGTGLGAVFADYDEDGDQDLFVTNNGPNRLYRNDGAGRFEDVAAAAGVDDDGPSTSASWADYDADGDLDLYVAGYGYCGGTDIDTNLEYMPDHLYRNEGDGTFADVTSLLGPPAATMGAGFLAAWFDYDLDGDVDLYLANDYVGPAPKPNVLWRNDGPDGQGGWVFTDVSVSSGAGVSINTMGIAVGDYDMDGDFDLALSNIRANTLLRNNGNGTFSDVAQEAGIARDFQAITERAITWGLAFYDLNNDTREDLYITAGDLGYEDGFSLQPNETFLNLGGGRFSDVSAASNADDVDLGRGVGFADYDRDGRIDLYLVNHTGATRLLRNTSKRGGMHWLEIDTVGTGSVRDGCGALLRARLRRGPTLVRQVLCGGTSLASGVDPTVHFGLGRWDRVKTLTIRWPSGTVQVLKRIRANRLRTVTEPA
jgi:hypothetical protein